MKKSMTAIALSLTMMGAAALPAFAASPARSADPAAEPLLIAQQMEKGSARYRLLADGKDLGVITAQTIPGTDGGQTVMLPLRAIAEKLGFTVEWKDGAAVLDSGSMHTSIVPGEDSFQVTTSIAGMVGMSAPFSLESAPYVDHSVIYVPLSLFVPLLGNDPAAVVLKGDTLSITTGAGTDPGDNAQIPDPFQDYTSLAEAVKAAGIDLSLRSLPAGYPDVSYSTIPGDLIQVVCLNGEDEICIRKGADEQDISGDYNDYAQSRTVDVGGRSVTLKGNDGTVSLAAWVQDGHFCSVMARPGVTEAQMTALVSAVR